MFSVNVLYGKAIKLGGVFDYPRPGNQKCSNLMFALGEIGKSITSSSEQEFSLHIRRFLWAKRGERGMLREARGEEFKEALLGVSLTRHGETDHAKRGKIVICINPKFFLLTSFGLASCSSKRFLERSWNSDTNEANHMRSWKLSRTRVRLPQKTWLLDGQVRTRYDLKIG